MASASPWALVDLRRAKSKVARGGRRLACDPRRPVGDALDGDARGRDDAAFSVDHQVHRAVRGGPALVGPVSCRARRARTRGAGPPERRRGPPPTPAGAGSAGPSGRRRPAGGSARGLARARSRRTSARDAPSADQLGASDDAVLLAQHGRASSRCRGRLGERSGHGPTMPAPGESTGSLSGDICGRGVRAESAARCRLRSGRWRTSARQAARAPGAGAGAVGLRGPSGPGCSTAGGGARGVVAGRAERGEDGHQGRDLLGRGVRVDDPERRGGALLVAPSAVTAGCSRASWAGGSPAWSAAGAASG